MAKVARKATRMVLTLIGMAGDYVSSAISMTAMDYFCWPSLGIRPWTAGHCGSTLITPQLIAAGFLVTAVNENLQIASLTHAAVAKNQSPIPTVKVDKSHR